MVVALYPSAVERSQSLATYNKEKKPTITPTEQQLRLRKRMNMVAMLPLQHFSAVSRVTSAV